MIRLLKAIFSSLGPPGPAKPGPSLRSSCKKPRRMSCGRPCRNSPHSLRKLSRARQKPSCGDQTVIAYHGTPSIENSRSILRDGWLTGSGNAAGDGKYFATDLATARSYAGASGVYLKCSIKIGKCCRWTVALDKEYQSWCRLRAVRQDNSAKTAFLLTRGFHSLRTGNVIVVLSPKMANPSAFKRKDPRIRILSIHRAADNRRIRV